MEDHKTRQKIKLPGFKVIFFLICAIVIPTNLSLSVFADPLPQSESKALIDYPNWVTLGCPSGYTVSATVTTSDTGSTISSIPQGGEDVAASEFSNATGYHGDSLAGTYSFAELSPPGTPASAVSQQTATDLGGLPYQQKLAITYGGKTVVAEKLDIGQGGSDFGGKPRAIDLTSDKTAQALGFSRLDIVHVKEVADNTPLGPVSDPSTLTDTGSQTTPSNNSSSNQTSCSCSSSSEAVITVLTGSDNEEKIYNYFIAKGLSPVQSAGIVGNFGQESGWNPNDSGGYLAQWSASRLAGLAALAQKEGRPETDLGVQLDYVWQELNAGYRSVLSNLRQATTVEDAVNQFMGPNDTSGQPVSVFSPSQRSGGYEDPGIPAGQNRVNFANNALQKFGGGGGGGTAVASCASATSSPDCQNATGDVKILCEAKKYDPTSYSEAGGVEDGHGSPAAWHQQCPIIGPSCYTDCSGLVNLAVYDAFGVVLEENTYSEYSDTAHWQHIPFSQVQPGDLIMPPISGETFPGHVEVVDHVSGNQIYTFGSHTSSVPQPDQVGPAQFSYTSGDAFLHYIGPQ